MHCNAPSACGEQRTVPTYASVAGCHVAEDIAEPVQIEDRVGNGIPTISVSSLSTYALQCTKCE
jgi:hypothetical protein